MSSDQSKSPGALVADQLLGHEGRVGADHDQLAMRHVDDAHHPEGDGEPDRGEQQHRAERQPEPDVLRLAPHRLACARSPRPPSFAAAAISGSSARLQRRQRRQRVAAAPLRRRPPIAATRSATSASPSRAAPPPRASSSACLTPGSALRRQRGVGSPRAARGPGVRNASSAAASRRAGSGCHQRQRRRCAERTARRSALLTLTASVERAAHRPELGAGQRVEALGLRRRAR